MESGSEHPVSNMYTVRVALRKALLEHGHEFIDGTNMLLTTSSAQKPLHLVHKLDIKGLGHETFLLDHRAELFESLSCYVVVECFFIVISKATSASVPQLAQPAEPISQIIVFQGVSGVLRKLMCIQAQEVCWSKHICRTPCASERGLHRAAI